MLRYEVLLGVDRAARDTGRRIRLVVRESDELSAAIKAEKLADRRLDDPVEYTHAMRVRSLSQPATQRVLAMAA